MLKSNNSQIASLFSQRQTWVVTGGAGFIGSNICEELIRNGQEVHVLDNLSTGKVSNIQLLRALAASSDTSFRFTEGDIRDSKTCMNVVEGADFVIHQAALGSVPRSISDPHSSLMVNFIGFVNVLNAARAANIKRLVYASSSSVYGTDASETKKETRVGNVLSPYALSKRSDEEIARLYSSLYGMEMVGLRYFNVFGPRQDPNGPYAAVIPKWMSALASAQIPCIYGDGETSRDFCFVSNVVRANLLACQAILPKKVEDRVFNIACGQKTSLKELYSSIAAHFEKLLPSFRACPPEYKDFRTGDIRHSLAEITHAQKYLGYTPLTYANEGIEITVKSFLEAQGVSMDQASSTIGV